MNILGEKKLILDGAMGTVLQEYKIEAESFLGSEKVFEVLNLTEESIVKEIHKKYIEAGADIIETNTFNCNIFSLEGSGLDKKIFEICKKGAELAREVAQNQKEILVAGAIGPTNMMLSKDNEIEEKMRKSYKEQIGGVIAGNVDFLLIETVYDYKNLKIALEEALKFKGKPIVISFTCNNQGKIYSGEKIEKIIKEIDRDEIIGYGLNCVGGNFFIEQLRDITSKKIFYYPNDNLLKDNLFKEYLRNLLESNKVDILGGCCGTNYEFIKTISGIMKKKY